MLLFVRLHKGTRRLRRMVMLRNCLSLQLIILLIMVSACAGEGTSSTGALFITSNPSGADVLLNGELRGRTPLTVRDLEPGEYEVVLRKDGFEDAQVITAVRARQTSNVASAMRNERAPITHRLAFFSNRDGAFDIWTTDENGGDLSRWSLARWPHAPLQAALSPDGNNFALSVESAGNSIVTWIVNAPRPQGEITRAEARTIGGDTFRLLNGRPIAARFS